MEEIKIKFEAVKAFVLGHKKSFAIAGGVIFIFLAPLLFSPKDKQAGNSARGQWQVYTSEALGFSLSHPAGWSVKETDAESGPDILALEPKGLAFVRIRGLLDPDLDSEEAIKASVADYRNSLARQEGVLVFDFKTGEIKADVVEFWTEGEFVINGKTYRFEERGQLSLAGQVLIMRAADAPAGFDISKETMEKIMESFKIR